MLETPSLRAGDITRLKSRYSLIPYRGQILGKRRQVRYRREKVDLIKELTNYLRGKGLDIYT